MKIISVVGARPQFIKAAVVSQVLKKAGHSDFLVHTGQHYDYKMSQVFFDELGIANPDKNLEVGSGPHGWQTGQMLNLLEETMLMYKPDWVLVYGDTNSTLAGAIAACKLGIPIAHVEAGLRSFNRSMPEEHNRVLADHCADILFCPTPVSVENLSNEGILNGVHLVGDVMVDSILAGVEQAEKKSEILQKLELQSKKFLLATIHRPENTDNKQNLAGIISAFVDSGEKIVFPAHPRTLKYLKSYGLLDEISKSKNIVLIPPAGYIDMIKLIQSARMILTDSGGVQKEAYCLYIPCITLRKETEWVETVQSGWNILTGADKENILDSMKKIAPPENHPPFYGDGRTADKIVKILEQE